MKTGDFTTAVAQLNLVGGVLRVPHPLSNNPIEELHKFHTDFISYCVQNNLPHVVWQYCVIHK